MRLQQFPRGLGVGDAGAALASDDHSTAETSATPQQSFTESHSDSANRTIRHPNEQSGADEGPVGSTRTDGPAHSPSGPSAGDRSEAISPRDAEDSGAASGLVSDLQSILRGPPGERPRWWRCWTCVITHPWYREELRAVAQRVARWTGNGGTATADIEHGAILLLARDLQRHPAGHRQLVESPAQFAGWMSRIIYRHCLQVDRRQRRHERRTVALVDEGPAAARDDMALRIDLAMCLKELAPELRRAVGLYTQGFTQQEIAQLEDVHQATISRRLTCAIEYLRNRLEREDGTVPRRGRREALPGDSR